MSDTKKLANLIDQTTGLSLNPFWINASDVPVELKALKDSYPKDDSGNILQLVHDAAEPGVQSYDVKVACCPHDMNGLLTNKATTNAYIWGAEYNKNYDGALWYNDLSKREVGPLEITLNYDNPLENAKNFKTFKLSNPNYFVTNIPWKLYSERKIIFNKVYTTQGSYLEKNPILFDCGIKIRKNHSYRIYYSAFNCKGNVIDDANMLNLKVEVSVTGESWDPVRVADGSGSGAALILNALDNNKKPLEAGYVDVVFEKDYNYMRVQQYWGINSIPDSKSVTPGGWYTGGGEAYAYIKSIPYFKICTSATHYLESLAEEVELQDEHKQVIELNNYLNVGAEVIFEYQTTVNDVVCSFLTDVGIDTIMNRWENPIKKQSLIKPTTPIIEEVLSTEIKCFYPSTIFNFCPGSSLTDITLFITQGTKVIAQQLVFIGGGYAYTLTGLIPDNTYSLFAAVTYNSGGQSFTYYSDIVEFKTMADNLCKIKFRTDYSMAQGVFWNNPENPDEYEKDATTVTITRNQQLIAWTSKIPFYYPTMTTSRGYYIEVDITDTLLKTVTDINIESTLTYKSDSKDVKCLLQNTYEYSTGKTFWDKEINGKKIYGKSFKYTYEGTTTNSADKLSYDVYYHGKYVAGSKDTLEITVKGEDAEGNTLQYVTNYPVYAPMTRASRD